MVDPTRPRPQVQSQRAPVQLQRVNTARTITPPSDTGDATARGLVEGLAALNPSLSRLLSQEYAARAAAAAEAGQRDGAAMELDPNVVNNVGEDSPLPQGIPAAFGEHYFNSLRGVVAKRVAQKSANDLLFEYQKRAQDPNFDSAAAEAFVQEWKNTQYAGIMDQQVLGELAPAHNAALEQIRQAQRGIDVARIKERATQQIGALTREAIKGSMSPQEAYSVWRDQILPASRALGQHSHAELTALFIGQLQNESDRLGGMPELFSALTDFPDETGKSIVDYAAGQGVNVEALRERASRMREQRLQESAQAESFQFRASLQDMLRDEPAALTDEYISERIGGVNGLSVAEALSLREQRDRALAKVTAAPQLDALAATGNLHIADPKLQRDWLESKAQPLLGSYLAMQQAVAQIQDPEERAAAIRATTAEVAVGIQALHAKVGASVVYEPLQRLLVALKRQTPGRDAEPSVQFLTAAEMYRALPANLRDAYADEDSRFLFDNYLDAVNGGADQKSAFHQAYRAISPEAKAAAEQMLKNPEVQKRIEEMTNRYIPGTTRFVPDFITRRLGWSATNTTAITTEARSEAMRALRRNPNMTEDDLDAHVERWMSRNYILDRSSGVAIRVHPSMATDATSEAVSEYLQGRRDLLREDERNDGRWTVTMMADNVEQGRYQLAAALNGQPLRTLGYVTMDEVLGQHRQQRLFSPEEGQLWRELEPKIRSGTLTPEEREQHRAVIDKARALGFGASAFAEETRRSTEGFNRALAQRPRMDLGKADHSSLANTRVKVDHQLTARTAEQFYRQGGTRGTALALITMGEAVVLQRYPDPAKGDNIGMGYSLTANAKTARADLKRARVPPELIDDVIAGRASITPDQAMRLAEVAVGRYEEKARWAANNAAPGLWDRLSHTQRAVLIDVAWQTGDPGQFTRAMQSLVRGDMEAFKDQIKVRFRDRSTGQMREDTRRNNLRASLIDGSFGAAMREAARIPSTRIAALNQ